MKLHRLAQQCCLLVGVAMLCSSAASAQGQPPPTSAGPGRITCSSAASCELTIGTPPSMRYRIDASALADADKQRLTGACKPKGNPCVATVQGTEAPGGKGIVKATTIKFYN